MSRLDPRQRSEGFWGASLHTDGGGDLFHNVARRGQAYSIHILVQGITSQVWRKGRMGDLPDDYLAYRLVTLMEKWKPLTSWDSGGL